MPDPIIYIQPGQIVQEGELIDPDGDGLIGFRISTDGARRVELFRRDYAELEHSIPSIYLQSPIPSEQEGLIAVPEGPRGAQWLGPNVHTMLGEGAYIGYDFTVNPHSNRPVNQIPYILPWRQHVGQIVHDFYTTYAADAFILENNLSGLSPADVSLTSEQEYSFEIITNQIRKLVGITWGRIDAYAAIRPEGSDTWKAQTPTLQALVHKLCETCRGEGWKIDLIVDREDGRWGSYGADRSRVYYPTRNVEGRWEAGDRLAHTTEERDAHLRHWRNARRYHRSANGDEGDPYLDAPLPVVQD